MPPSRRLPRICRHTTRQLLETSEEKNLHAIHRGIFRTRWPTRKDRGIELSEREPSALILFPETTRHDTTDTHGHTLMATPRAPLGGHFFISILNLLAATTEKGRIFIFVGQPVSAVNRG